MPTESFQRTSTFEKSFCGNSKSVEKRISVDISEAIDAWESELSDAPKKTENPDKGANLAGLFVFWAEREIGLKVPPTVKYKDKAWPDVYLVAHAACKCHSGMRWKRFCGMHRMFAGRIVEAALNNDREEFLRWVVLALQTDCFNGTEAEAVQRLINIISK